MKLKGIIVSGYFNPLHRGHIELFHKAKSIGDKLFVIVNNDFQRTLKGSKEFMLENERALILSELSIVDEVIISEDMDRTVCKTLKSISSKYDNQYEFYFANGGDQNNQTIPEKDICNKLNIKLIEGMGKKVQSSSWILNK